MKKQNISKFFVFIYVFVAVALKIILMIKKIK